MKKLNKVKNNMQDTVEAYAGICNCSIGCNCITCGAFLDLQDKGTYSVTEATSLSIVSSHHTWA